MNIGEHDAKCIEYAMNKAKNQLELLMETQDGQKGNVFLSFSEKAKPWSLKKMAALGWIRGQGLDGLKIKPVTVQARDEEYNGQVRRKHDIIRGDGFEIGGGLMTKDADRMSAAATQEFLDNIFAPPKSLGSQPFGRPDPEFAQEYPAEYIDPQAPPPNRKW